MDVHGGPVGSWRRMWALRTGLSPLLVQSGYAIFLPNPRGSVGKGQDFIAGVLGDMGGADTDDYLSGLDHLVAEGVADPARIGVMGGSYGGFMSAWIITRTDRFAASIPSSPVTDWFSQHYNSNIGDWDSYFLDDVPSNPSGKYFERSPVFFTEGVTTPTMVIAGLDDRCTPPGQAIEFYEALRMAGAEAELVLYPGEGHGVGHFPAAIDYAARCLAWFERFMPAR